MKNRVDALPARPHAALFALLLFACLAFPARAQDEEEGDDDLPVPILPPAPVVGVKKITDGALTCEQLLAESAALEQRIAASKAASESAMKEANEAREAMGRSATGGAGTAAAGSLLGLVPGGSMIGGLAAQASAQAQLSAIQSSSNRMTQAYQRYAEHQQDLQFAMARNDHVVDLFGRKRCKVPMPAEKAPAADGG